MTPMTMPSPANIDEWQALQVVLDVDMLGSVQWMLHTALIAALCMLVTNSRTYHDSQNLQMRIPTCISTLLSWQPAALISCGNKLHTSMLVLGPGVCPVFTCCCNAWGCVVRLEAVPHATAAICCRPCYTAERNSSTRYISNQIGSCRAGATSSNDGERASQLCCEANIHHP
jgi:hypothetical protein